MAIKAFTRKTSGPTSSEEFLKDYENLLKRNRGGGTFMGYDTSSQTPIYLGTSVSDPMGLGQTASTKTQDSNTSDISETSEIFNEVLNSLTDEVSTEDVLAVYDFLNDYVENSLPTLTDEQKQQIVPILGGLINKTGDIINTRSGNTEAYSAGIESPIGPISPKYSTDTLSKRLYEEGQGIGGLMADVNQTSDKLINTATDYRNQLQEEADTKRNLLKKYNTSPEYATARKQQEMFNEISKTGGLTPESKTELERINNEEAAAKVGLSPEEYVRRQQSLNDIQSYKAPEEDSNKAIDDFKNWLSGAGGTISNTVKNVRQTAGNVASYIGDKAGLPEMNISETIAGGPTKDYNKVYAAEPETLQAGSGLNRIQEGTGYNQNGLVGRQDFSQFGLKRAIGDVAGVQGDQNVSLSKNILPSDQSVSGITKFSQAVTPSSTTLPEFKPEVQRETRNFGEGDLNSIVDAMMSRGYNNRAEAEAVAKSDINRFGNEYMPLSSSSNIGVGSNQPSTQTNQQNNQQSNKKSYTYSPTTSNNAMSNSNLANLGKSNFVMPTVGVGSNQPSTQSSNQSSGGLISTISNILSNLFRRKQ